MNVVHGKREGSFDLAHPSEKQDLVYLHLGEERFSETWPLGESPYSSSMLPSQVMDLLEERLDSYWISTKREETKKRMAACRERLREYDLRWLNAQLENAKKKVREFEELVASFTEEAA